MPLKLIFTSLVISLAMGCSTLGQINASSTLTNDAVGMITDDLAGLGPKEIISTRINIDQQGETISVTLYQPRYSQAAAPAIVFLPGRMATDDQYESYARALASRGFVVAVHGWYSLFVTDLELAHDAEVMADWLITKQGVDATKIGIAGHSMGAKDAVLAATKSGLFNADSKQVRIIARRATVGFFMQHLMSGPVLASPQVRDGLIRVAQNNQVIHHKID